MVGIMEAGQAVGDDLGCGPGSGFGGSLVRSLLCGCSLSLCGCGSYCQIMLGRQGQRGLSVRDDEDLFELIEVGGGPELNESVRLMVQIGFDGLDGADGKTARVHLISAGGEDLLAWLNTGVGGEVVDEDLAGCAASKNGANSCGDEDDAGARGLVVDEQDLGGVGEDIAELADDAVGRDDRLVRFKTVFRTFVDVENAREVAATGADDLSGYRCCDVVLLEVKERLKAMALDSVLGECGLFEAEAGDLILKIVVLLAGVTKIDVVGPDVAKVIAESMEETFEWSHGSDSPVTDESDATAVGSAGLNGTANLDGKADGLGEQNSYQNKNVFVACDEGFHALGMIICELTRWRSWRGGYGCQLFSTLPGRIRMGDADLSPGSDFYEVCDAVFGTSYDFCGGDTTAKHGSASAGLLFGFIRYWGWQDDRNKERGLPKGDCRCDRKQIVLPG
jgi:hypothetical protein